MRYEITIKLLLVRLLLLGLTFHEFLLFLAHSFVVSMLEPVDKSFEVTQEVILFVSTRLINGSFVVPVVPHSFSSHIKFDEFLEFEVGAAESVSQPFDRLLLDNKAEEDHRGNDVPLHLILLLAIIEDSDKVQVELIPT